MKGEWKTVAHRRTDKGLGCYSERSVMVQSQGFSWKLLLFSVAIAMLTSVAIGGLNYLFVGKFWESFWTMSILLVAIYVIIDIGYRIAWRQRIKKFMNR